MDSIVYIFLVYLYIYLIQSKEIYEKNIEIRSNLFYTQTTESCGWDVISYLPDMLIQRYTSMLHLL